MKSKNAIQMIKSTWIIIIAFLLVAIFILFYAGSMTNFWEKLKGYNIANIEELREDCIKSCENGDLVSFCCDKRKVNLGDKIERITCQNERINIDCNISCNEAC